MKKIINQQDMKERNAADVFAFVKKNGVATRKEIAEQLSMSWGAVSTITALLLEAGYLTERKSAEGGTAGRIPSRLSVNEEIYYAVGLDINDTGLRAVAADLSDRVIASFSAEASFKSPDALFECVATLVEEVIAAVPHMRPICIGAAMQGIVDAENGVSLRIPGRQNWQNAPLSAMLEQRFHIPVFLRHDPDCILYAYAKRVDERNAMLVRVDHGIGMAAMLDGEIIARPGIFELGHTVVVPGGAPCGCGKRGCLDQYASIRGMKTRANAKFSALATAAKNGDREAQALFSDAARYLALAITNTAGLLSVDHVLLCGRLFDFKALFFPELISESRNLSPLAPLNFVLTNVTDAPLGAALIAMNAALRKIGI